MCRSAPLFLLICTFLVAIDEADYSVPSHRSNMNINETGPVQLKLLCGADLLESFGTPGLWKEADVSVHRYFIKMLLPPFVLFCYFCTVMIH